MRVPIPAFLILCLLASPAAAASPDADAVPARDIELPSPELKRRREVLALDGLLDSRSAAQAQLLKDLARLDETIARQEGYLSDPKLENPDEIAAALSKNKAARAAAAARLEQALAAKKELEAKLKGKVGALQEPPGVDFAKAAEEARENPGGHLWLFRQVRPGGPWDFKTRGPQYENFGNYFYGFAGAAAGMSKEKLLRAAGAVQVWVGTSHEEWGKPGNDPPYGDDPIDQYWIKRGIELYEKEHAPR